MIKKIIKFIGGFFIGSIVIYALIYGIGSILENNGVVLYESERDQQRNFNITMIAWLIGASITGYLFTRFGK